MFNLAIPGSTLADVSEQTPALLPARRPDTLLVAAGINDSAVPVGADDGDVRPDPAHVDAGLDSLAATALRHGARLVVAGPAWLDADRTRDTRACASPGRAHWPCARPSGAGARRTTSTTSTCGSRCAGTAGCSSTGCTPPPRATGSSTGTSVP
nr:hypothetical protein [Streptomyces sp. Sge12]